LLSIYLNSTGRRRLCSRKSIIIIIIIIVINTPSIAYSSITLFALYKLASPTFILFLRAITNAY
jgi:hypothetical protein